MAAELVNAVLLDGHSLTQRLAVLRGESDGRVIAAGQSLAYGTLRAAGRLRFFLRQLAPRALTPPRLAGYLLVGLHELEGGSSPAYAAVNETVALVGRRFPRARGFANAVLRHFQRRHAELVQAARDDDEARWNFPAWWLARLRQELPSRWREIVETQNQHPPMTLRVNPRRTTLPAYREALARAGIEHRHTGTLALTLARPMPVAELPGFTSGLVSVQDLGAQCAAPLLRATHGMRVLDACAAPGGKSGHLLELAELDLLALDSDAARLSRVRDNLARLGLRAELRAADAGVPADWWDGRPFDRILLDAPCTASGVARRHPDGKWLKRAEDMQQLAREQRRLFDALWPLLRPGGRMLYATCSLFRAENSDQVAAFLSRHPDAAQETIAAEGAREGLILPGPDVDGFFYASLLKT